VRVVFAAARSSPGVTTALLACASVWPTRVLLVEAAEDGGALAARFGLPVEPGLTTLAAASRHGGNGDDPAALLTRHLQALPGTGRIDALVGPAPLEAAQALLRSAASMLDGLLGKTHTDVLVDAGRLPATPLARPLIQSADRLLLVVRPRVEELTALAHRLPHLTGLGPPPQLVLVGDRPYGPDEVAGTLGVPVAGVLAHDPTAADALAAVGPSKRLGRSPLLRSAGELVDRLIEERADTPPQDADVEVPRVDGAPVAPRRRRLLAGRS
jgi:hypothetical protein